MSNPYDDLKTSFDKNAADRAKKEAYYAAQLKPLVKLLQLPSGGRLGFHGPDVWSWNKRGGFAGDKAVERVKAAAIKAGWSNTPTSHAVPDGSTIGRGGVFYSPEGHQLNANSSYGGVKSDNYFTISLKLVPLKENRSLRKGIISEMLTQQQAKSLLSDWRSGSYTTIDDVLDQLTPQQKSWLMSLDYSGLPQALNAVARGEVVSEGRKMQGKIVKLKTSQLRSLIKEAIQSRQPGSPLWEAPGDIDAADQYGRIDGESRETFAGGHPLQADDGGVTHKVDQAIEQLAMILAEECVETLSSDPGGDPADVFPEAYNAIRETVISFIQGFEEG